MSAGRRSWRPENKRDGRKSRNRSIAVLIGVLVTLVAILVIPLLLPREPLVRFVSLVPGGHGLDRSGMPVLPHSAAAYSRTLEQFFIKLREKNTHRVAEPATVTWPDGLKSTVAAGEKLVLYCPIEAAVRLDDTGAPVVQLGGERSPKVLSEFLRELQELKASRIILLLDLVGHAPGLASGSLGDDVVPLIGREVNTAVTEAGMTELAVICSSGPGERSWEYLRRETAAAATSESNTAATAEASLKQSSFEIYSGTVFAHYVRQSFLDGKSSSLEELYEYLTSQVNSFVEREYSETQSVVLFPQRPKYYASELLLRIKRPSEEELVEVEPKEAASSEETTDSDSEPDVKKGDATVESTSEVTLESSLAELIEQQHALTQAGEAIAATSGLWMDLNAYLLSAKSALLHGDESTFKQMYSEADRTLKAISRQLQSSSSIPQAETFYPWITPPALASATTTDDSPSPTERFEDALNDVSREKDPSLPRELRKRGPGSDRNAFVHWLLGDLQKLAKGINSKPAAAQQKETGKYVRFIRNLSDPDLNWPKKDWPQEFFTIEEVFTGDNAEWHVESLKPLVRLSELRRDAMAAATGRLENGSRVRTDVWRKESIEKLLVRLTEAERWLAMSAVGLQMANHTLGVAEAGFEDLSGQTKLQQDLVQISDAQRTDLPVLIQFIAQQQEKVPLPDTVLASAQTMVADGTNILTIPAGLVDEQETWTVVDAMFALTRRFTDTPVDRQDQEHLRRVASWVRRRFESADQFTKRGGATTVPESDTLHAMFFNCLTSPGRPTRDRATRRTGIWLSFWSIRLLEAFSGETQSALWTQWANLVSCVRADNSSDASIVARAKLATALRTQWIRQNESLDRETSRSIFVTYADAKNLIARDLEERYAASGINRAAYASIHDDFSNKELVRGESITIPDTALLFDDDNFARVKIDPGNAAALYVSKSDIRLNGIQASLRENWYRLTEPQSISELIFETGNGLTKAVEVTIAIADRSDVVVDWKTVTVHPNANTAWTARFFTPDGIELDQLEGDLKLPPGTQNPQEETDAPIPLIVRLIQSNGKAEKIRVQCLDADGKKFWAKEQVLDVDPATNTAIVPLQAAAAEAPANGTTPPAANAPPAGFNILNDLTFQVTPELFGAETQSVRIRPVLSHAEQFVDLPNPEFKQNRLTFTLIPVNAPEALQPKTLPIVIHFNAALKAELNAAATALDLPAAGHEFSFTFKDGLQQRMGKEPLEFGISVAGIPHAWRWRLGEDRVYRLAGDEPVVRAELSVANPKDVQLVPGAESLMLGKDWDKAQLDVEMHIHGGQFTGTPEWALKVKIASQVAQHDVLKAIELRSRRKETIRVTPGENGVWNFSTHTELYARRSLRIKDEFRLGQGRYDVVAQLQRIAEPRSEPIEVRAPFVFDDSEPDVAKEDIKAPDRCSVADVLNGYVAAADPESGIVAIKVGLSADKMQVTKPVGVFEFKRSQGFPEIKPPLTEAQGTLYVEVVNAAGLSKKLSKDVMFFGPAAPMEKPAVKPGIVTFDWSSATPYTVTLKGPDYDETMVGKRPLKFPEVPPGKYTITWKTGVAFGNGSKNVTVKSGSQTFDNSK